MKSWRNSWHVTRTGYCTVRVLAREQLYIAWCRRLCCKVCHIRMSYEYPYAYSKRNGVPFRLMTHVRYSTRIETLNICNLLRVCFYVAQFSLTMTRTWPRNLYWSFFIEFIFLVQKQCNFVLIWIEDASVPVLSPSLEYKYEYRILSIFETGTILRVRRTCTVPKVETRYSVRYEYEYCTCTEYS